MPVHKIEAPGYQQKNTREVGHRCLCTKSRLPGCLRRSHFEHFRSILRPPGVHLGPSRAKTHKMSLPRPQTTRIFTRNSSKSVVSEGSRTLQIDTRKTRFACIFTIDHAHFAFFKFGADAPQNGQFARIFTRKVCVRQKKTENRCIFGPLFCHFHAFLR